MTLKEVARLAGVSPSAVSRYLNGGPLSSEKTAAIRAVIQRTGYLPNQAAHTLRTGRVRQIGVLVPRIHSEAVSKVTAGIAETLERRSYLPVLGSTGRDPAREERYLDMMRAYHVAGLAVMATTDACEPLYRRCILPLVITGQRLPGLNCVYHDDYGAMGELARRLIERGRRRIVYISADPGDAAVARERLRGARDALREAGFLREAGLLRDVSSTGASEDASGAAGQAGLSGAAEPSVLSGQTGTAELSGAPGPSGVSGLSGAAELSGQSEQTGAAGQSGALTGPAAYGENLSGRDGLPVAVSDFDWRGGYQAMARLLEAHPDADGVLCATDTMAQGAMLYLREAGRRVPEDISVAGVGDDWADLVSQPPLTAAQLDQFRCGREAAAILLDLLDNPGAEPREIRLGYTVVDRGSV